MIELKTYLENIEPMDPGYGEKAQKRENNLTKPPGSLGKLEELAIQIASIKREGLPKIKRKLIFTLAGDHGVTAEGVSNYPAAVTQQMVANMAAGGAAVNVLARHVGAEVLVADFGVSQKMEIDAADFRDKNIGRGTANFTREPAMTREQALSAIKAGIALFEEEHAEEKIDLVGTGEMGIGNTTPATAILVVISGSDVELVTGRGTGIDDRGLQRKIAAIKKGLALHQPDPEEGFEILQKLGGYEIGGLTGIILAAAKHRVPIFIDGFISTSAALIAQLLCPTCTDYMLAAHQSQEPGHKEMLRILDKEPLLNLEMRLGEGTGAALAMGMADAALKILHEMATFESAGVSNKKE